MHEGSDELYVNPGYFNNMRHIWLGAVGANYQTALLEKCCAACNYGHYDGVTYTFTSDSNGNTPATCKSFTLRFFNDPSFGYYCTFSSSALALPFDPAGSGAAGAKAGAGSIPYAYFDRMPYFEPMRECSGRP